MSTVLGLPTEVYAFLSLPAPQTLLLRGPPGAGKSTLALGLLENFRGRRFLVSSRVSAAELKREFPWMAGISDIRLVDAVHGSGSLEEASRAMTSLRRLVAEPEKEGELRGLWLPQPIQEVWSQASEREPSMVVIDSWDALIERYLGLTTVTAGLPTRPELERLLLDQLSQRPIFLVLVLEREEQTHLDYLVNAVVEVTSDHPEGRPERWLHLQKLRGTRIDSPTYPFTLENARFHCIGPMPTRVLDRALRPEAEPDSIPGLIWPGCSDFASAFGRLRVGRISLFEKSDSVANEAMALLIEPVAGHVARSGGRIVNVLAPNISPVDVLTMYREVLTPDQILQQVRFLLISQTGEVPDEMAKTVFPPPLSETSGSQPRTPEITRFLGEPGSAGVPNLAIVWVSALRAMTVERGIEYSPAMLPSMVHTGLSGASSHTVFLGPDDDPVIQSLRPVAATRIRLRSTAGRVFVWGEQPVTPSYALSPSDDTTQKPYHLLRIV